MSGNAGFFGARSEAGTGGLHERDYRVFGARSEPGGPHE
ncbi:hypothetical protein SAMN05518855_1018104 [Paenibacillus sp. CF384]|nr:hypothetical protein SAMN05518855_1018104 [Paenibacillus sp. CF384]